MNSISFWVANAIAAVFVLLVAAGAATPTWRGRVLSQDYLAGLMFQGFGLFVLWTGILLPLGTAIRMGPGYVPRMLGFIMLGIGALISAQSLFEAGIKPNRGMIRPFIMIMLSVVAFAVVFRYFGLLPAIVACVVIASAGDGSTKWFQTAISIGVLVFICVTVFIVSLDLPMDAGFGMPGSTLKNHILSVFRPIVEPIWSSLKAIGSIFR